jgi:hypothetical protein
MKFIMLACIFFALCGCEKIPRCETWMVKDSCTDYGNCYFYNYCIGFDSGQNRIEVCGDKLELISPNYIELLSGSNCGERVRTFLYRL